MRRIVVLCCFVLIVVGVLTGCTDLATEPADRGVEEPTSTMAEPAPSPSPTVEAAASPTPATASPTVVADTPTVEREEDTVTPTPEESRGINPALQPFIEEAVADLSARLNVDEEEIDVVRAEAVVWPDTSLGCPQPDMMYTQVLTDGSLIELEVDGTIYSYHSGRGRGPFLCENPKPPVPDATPGGGADT